jgi:hypothetical protein
MKIRGLFSLAAALLLSTSICAYGLGFGPGGLKPVTTGDGDPFPLKCVDFTGAWRSDAGYRYDIHQTNCKLLKIKMNWKQYGENTVSIVPDNLTRAIPGIDRSAMRHRWNSNRIGSVLESHRVFVEEGNKVIEVVMYERASENLLLETTYTMVESLTRPGVPLKRDYEQQVFRRIK